MNRAVVSVAFVVASIGVAIVSGSATPIAYGVGEANAQTIGSGILGTLMAVIGGATGFWNLFKNSTATGFVKDAIGNLTGGNAAGTVLDAAFVTIAATILAKKGAIDPTVLTRLGELRRDIEGEMKKAVP